MSAFVLYHHHPAELCDASYAAWTGFSSPLRHAPTVSTCIFGAHEIWWTVTAPDAGAALALLPGFVAERTVATRVSSIEIP